MHCKSYFVLFIQTILSRQITDKATEIADEIRKIQGSKNENHSNSTRYNLAAEKAYYYIRSDETCNSIWVKIIQEYNRIMKIEFDGLNSDEIIFKCKIPQDLQQQEIKERIEAKYKELVEGRQDLDDSKKEILNFYLKSQKEPMSHIAVLFDEVTNRHEDAENENSDEHKTGLGKYSDLKEGLSYAINWLYKMHYNKENLESEYNIETLENVKVGTEFEITITFKKK